MRIKKTYFLTDGRTVAKTRRMDPVELALANTVAEDATDGVWYWAAECPAFDARVEDGGGYCYNPAEVDGL